MSFFKKNPSVTMDESKPSHDVNGYQLNLSDTTRIEVEDKGIGNTINNSTDIIKAYSTTVYSGINPLIDTILEINPNVYELYPSYLSKIYNIDKISGYMSIGHPSKLEYMEESLPYNDHYSIENYSEINDIFHSRKLIDWVVINQPSTDEFIKLFNFSETTSQKGSILFLSKENMPPTDVIKILEERNIRYSVANSFSKHIFVIATYKGDL